jgi:lysophospholipase L1-like esterase
MRKFALALVWLCLLALAGCGHTPPPLPHLAQDDVVLAFGDSLTYGTGVDAAQSYPAVLSQLIGRNVISAGVPGEETAAGLARLPGELDKTRPKLLLLCLGGNDMLHKLAPASIAANLRGMVQMARQRGIAVVLIGVPAPKLFGGVPAFYAEIANAANVPYEDEAFKKVLFDSTKKSDPIHPNAAGYRIVAEKIAALLHAAGAV